MPNERTTDCLLIGFNDADFPTYVDMVARMGKDGGAYRDLRLAFIEHEGKPYRSMDLLNQFYFEAAPPGQPFHNADFLWPAILYLGSYLARRGLSFDYVNLFQREREQLREKLCQGRILTIAITTTLYVAAPPILEIIAYIRKYNRDAKIILGGPYVDNQGKVMAPQDLQAMYDYLGADFYVISPEGEQALAQIIQALKTNGTFDQIANIAYRQAGRFVVTPQVPESNSLVDEAIAYHLFPRDAYGQCLSVRTAKSCPFACQYCGFPQRAGQYTYMPVARVEAELDAIRAIGTISTITFINDTFNVPKGVFKELLRMMIRKQYRFKWNCYLRADHVDEEGIALMQESGCEGVFVGVESGSDKILQQMNKTARVKDYLTVFPWLAQAGISSHANLIVGFPGETAQTVQETIQLIDTAKPDFYRAQLWYCDPTTPIWQQREKYGIQGSAFSWSHQTMDFKTACDLVDKLFLEVKNSLWLPQYGFEQWSTFYLQRRGFSLAQIKTFIRCFNAAIKERLLQPHKNQTASAIIAGLRASCQPYTGKTVDLAAIEQALANQGGSIAKASQDAAEAFDFS